jgi:hypothetical protein
MTVKGVQQKFIITEIEALFLAVCPMITVALVLLLCYHQMKMDRE